MFGNPPVATYVFPAGGQRGTAVPVRVGGLFTHDKCGFSLSGRGLTASKELVRGERVWFEGPVIPQPESQAQEDYPADMLGTVAVAKDAPAGGVRGWLTTSQGVAGGLVFVVGELPEVVERERDGDPIPEPLTLPVTANGRVFPRDDVDLWAFPLAKGQTVTAVLHAPSLNSPLQPVVQLVDAAGVVVAEPMAHPVPGADASVKFTAPAAGEYRVRVTDARSMGGPAYVYRLTVTTAAVPDYEFPLKAADGLTGPIAPFAGELALPAAVNGRVAKPGDADAWRVPLAKGKRCTLELQARRLGSPLCGVITVSDAAGKELARADAADPSADPTLTFTPPADGVYTVRVGEKFRGRGGPHFVYRLRLTEPAVGAPAFKLTVPADSVSVLRGGTARLRVSVERTGGPTGPIQLDAVGLPDGVSFTPKVIPANQPGVDVTFKADEAAPVGTVPVTITGAAGGKWGKAVRAAVAPGGRLVPSADRLLFGVGLPAPFKLIDQFVMTAAPRGEVYRRKYRIERNGFDGPITVALAEKQARHLQGVSGPTLVVPPGVDELDYPATLPPWMELGRTCRVCVIATATVKDEAGREHVVSFSSTDQNQQMIVVVEPGRLDLELGRTNVRVPAGGGEVRLPVRVARGRGLAGPATVAVAVPAGLDGVSAAAVTIPAGESAGEVALTFAPGAGPFTMPLAVRAAVADGGGPVVAEAKLELVK